MVKLQEFNYFPIVHKMNKSLKKYDKMVYSWIGRINIVKMDILPTLLYVFQAIPLIPQGNLMT